MTTKMNAPIPTITDEIEGVPNPVVDRLFDLLTAFTEAAVADDTFVDGVPHSARLAMIPDDDPELANYAIEAGLASVKRGQNVFFLHLTHDAEGNIAIKWPEETLPPREERG